MSVPAPNDLLFAIERRLVDLEERYAHQERLIEDLDAVIVEQSKEIALLKADVRRLGERALRGEPEIPNEPPPHY